jgi:hypothetical protein
MESRQRCLGRLILLMKKAGFRKIELPKVMWRVFSADPRLKFNYSFTFVLHIRILPHNSGLISWD